MKNGDNDKVISEFIAISGCSSAEARSYLHKFNFSLTQALNEYYRDQSPRAGADVPRNRKARKVPKPTEISDFFNSFAASDGSVIGPEGIEKMCSLLEINPLDVVWLVIANHCQCHTMGHFTFEEWKRGMLAVGCGSVYDLKESIPSLRSALKDSPEDFKELYMFSFKYSLDQDVRNLPLETALALWHILLPYSRWELKDKWIEYMESDEVRSKGKAITKDVWNLLISFAKEVPTTSSITRFERDSGAWPIVFDDFYDYLIS